MKQCLFCSSDLLCSETLYQAFTLRPRYTFCADCSKQLELIERKKAVCIRCCKDLPTQGICLDCQYWEATEGHVVQQHAVFHYNPFIVAVLWQIKHNGDIHLIRGFYPAVKRALYQTYDFSTTLFIPIPTNMASLRARRFHLIAFVFNELQLPLHLVPLFVMTDEKHVKQHTLSKRERLQTVSQSYLIDEAKRKVLHERTWDKIVIIDDVYTTGATIIKARKSLPSSLKKRLCSFTLFR